jgi:hypothetical protein
LAKASGWVSHVRRVAAATSEILDKSLVRIDKAEPVAILRKHPGQEPSPDGASAEDQN